MSDTQRYTDIHTIEALAAGQGIRYTFDNGLVTFHTPDGDTCFNWLEASGIPNTLRWLERRVDMSDVENLDPNLRRQYTSAYGPFKSGEYPLGSNIKAPGTSGEVIWSYQGAYGLTYVVDTTSGFPVEVQANEVREAK